MPTKKRSNTVKSTKKRPVQPKTPTLLDRLPKNEIEHLELMLKFTERAIPSRGGSGVDKGMVAQAERLKERIKTLKGV